jgi:hypothetical protein
VCYKRIAETDDGKSIVTAKLGADEILNDNAQYWHSFRRANWSLKSNLDLM